MNGKNNDSLNIDHFEKQKINTLDSIYNNAPTVQPIPIPEFKPLDKVKDMPLQKRNRDLER